MNKLEFIKEKGGAFRGRNELLKHLSGTKITARQAITAKCYECNGYYADGKADCKMQDCSLYPWMPYREGGARKSKILSEAQKKAASDRLRKGRDLR